MITIINDDFTALLIDKENPTLMLRLPSYNVNTMKPFTKESEVVEQCRAYEGRLDLFFDYVSPEEEANNLLDRQKEIIRDKRNELLASSDWTQVIDAPVDQAAWKTYRQALREIPSQAGFPNEVTWPVQPE